MIHRDSFSSRTAPVKARADERQRVERRYRDIVEFARHYLHADMDGRITSINEAGARFFGRPAFDLIGEQLSTLIGEDTAAATLPRCRT